MKIEIGFDKLFKTKAIKLQVIFMRSACKPVEKSWIFLDLYYYAVYAMYACENDFFIIFHGLLKLLPRLHSQGPFKHREYELRKGVEH